jgi:hypothetical protein
LQLSIYFFVIPFKAQTFDLIVVLSIGLGLAMDAVDDVARPECIVPGQQVQPRLSRTMCKVCEYVLRGNLLPV